MLDTAMRTMLEEAGGEQVDDPGANIFMFYFLRPFQKTLQPFLSNIFLCLQHNMFRLSPCSRAIYNLCQNKQKSKSR